MSSVLRVPERPGLTLPVAWRAVRAVGWPVAKEVGVRFRYGDGFSHSRAFGLQLALAVIPLVIAVIGLSEELGSGSLGRVVRRTVLALTPGSRDGLWQHALGRSDGARPDPELALWAGLVVALGALTTAMGQLERGANRIYGIQRDRPSLRKYGRAALLAVTAGLPAMTGFAVLVAASAFGRSVEQVYGIDDDVVGALAWPLGIALMLGALIVLMRHGPRRSQPCWGLLVLCAGLALVLWLGFTSLLAGYIMLSTGLSGFYGPLTGVLALLVWAQLTAGAVFVGLAVCAQVEATVAGCPTAADVDRDG